MILHLQNQNYSSLFIVSNSQHNKNTTHQLKTTTRDSGLIFRQKLNYLSSLNINTHKALTLNPSLRTAQLSTLTSITDTLASLGLSRPAIGRILDMHPILLTSHPHTHIEFLLTTVQIPPHHLPKAITRCPRLLVTDVHSQLEPTLQFLHSIGFKVTWKTSLLLVSSVENTLLRKIEFLMGLGLSYEDVCRMVVRSPALLTLSVERNLKPKVELLFQVMRGGEGVVVEELKRFPQYFSFSLEGKIRPRFRVLKESGVRMRLGDMLKVSDGEFSARVVELRLKSVESVSLEKHC